MPGKKLPHFRLTIDLCRRAAALSLGLAYALALSWPAGANWESEIGKLASCYLEHEYGVCQEPLLNQWIQEVGTPVATAAERQSVKYRFRVVNSGQINAWALPGGYIYCTAGLLGHVDSDDDLAAVMAHEVAHMQNRDFQRTLLRQAAFMIVIGALTQGNKADWIQGLHICQLLDGLRQSRKHEAQADSVGVTLCARAGYDPQGLANFLSRIAAGQDRWNYWETLFSTHPHPERRQGWVELRIAEVFTPDERLALADQLSARARYKQALKHLRAAQEQQPDLLPAYTKAARLYLIQGRVELAQEQCQRALALEPKNQEIRGLLGQARSGPEEATDGLRAELSPELGEALEQSLEELRGQEETRRQLREQIARETRRLRGNQQFNQVLQLAKSMTTPWQDLASWALLAQAAEMVVQISHLADQVMEMRWIEYDLPGVLEAEADCLLESKSLIPSPAEFNQAGEYLLQAAQLTQEKHVLALEALARTMVKARRLAGEVCPLFLELLAAGEGRPFGKLVFSRVALMQAQLEIVRHDLEKAQEATHGVLTDLCAIKQAYYRARLARLGAEASRAQAGIYCAVLAHRYGQDSAQVQALWERQRDLGGVAEKLLDYPMKQPDTEENAPPSGKGPWDEAAYSRYVWLRLTAIRCAEERVSPATAEASEAQP